MIALRPSSHNTPIKKRRKVIIDGAKNGLHVLTHVPPKLKNRATMVR
jgi:hypothetical protein